MTKVANPPIPGDMISLNGIYLSEIEEWSDACFTAMSRPQTRLPVHRVIYGSPRTISRTVATKSS